MRRELLLGCGGKRVKDKRLPTYAELDYVTRNLIDPSTLNPRRGIDFESVTTVDINPAHSPDLLFDLSLLGMGRKLHSWEEHITPTPLHWWLPCPLCSNPIIRNIPCELCCGYPERCPDYYFDEIHAYEVLEHIGAQGDYKTFFAQFTELYRVLKPGGLFYATCPSWCSPWAWGDPSHTRVITAGTLAFLSQAEYTRQVGITPMSDFRNVYLADFQTVFVHEDSDTLMFVLKAIK